MPEVKFKRINSIQELYAIRESQMQFTPSGYTAFKDISKESLRYIRGSYAVLNGKIRLYYDMRKMGEVLLPANGPGEMSTVNGITTIELSGDFYPDRISSHCFAITSLVRRTPCLMPLEVQVSDPTLYMLLRCYTGDSWHIVDAQQCLKTQAVWLYIKEDYLK